jgi:formylglycine-generating enzyme required for sulfatase activity
MKNILTTIFILLFTNHVFANNLAISAPVYNAETLTFTISWDNSWNISTGPSNHDAVWVFIKRQKCTGNNDWVHQLVSTTSGDHLAKTGVSTSTVVSVIGVSDGMGVFIKRIGTDVVGAVASQTITLKLAATNPSISMTTADNFKVIGVEMVYVPQGEFFIGDGRPSNSNNFSAGNTPYPLKITNAIQNVNGLGAASNYTSNVIYGCSSPLPTTFPLGYNGFYTMKYEILQGVFIEYLNSLTYDQQAARLKVSNATYLPNGTPNVLFHGSSNSGTTNVYTTVAGNYNTKSAVFGGNYPYIPMSCMNWQDLTSILDWSGLRPMTEFEYEKACRGNNGGPTGSANAPVAYEFPWGNTMLNGVNSVNTGTNNNVISQSTSSTFIWTIYEGTCRNSEGTGPVRAGFAATSSSNRSQAGATYYGIMEMAGNVWEQCVGGGAGYDYSSFSTTNGDGVLTDVGLANVVGWPINGGPTSGTIAKGGSFYHNWSFNVYQVSDRAGNGATDANRNHQLGGRGVRSF